ncbi:MAG: HIT domain-containing protein [Candidatus Edwardsbacteria bacterium]
MKYILGKTPKGCILCSKPAEKNDKKNFVLFRGKKCFVMMNIFPYNNGHLMIAPYRHIANLEEMSAEEKLELMDVLSFSIKILNKVIKPEGFNAGINFGRVSGAGIEDHLHLHLVPRWSGDTNFMPIIANTKVVSEGLEETYKRLIKEFKIYESYCPKIRREFSGKC